MSVNHQQILDTAKEFLDSKDFDESEYYLNLFFQTNCNQLEWLLDAQSYLSFCFIKTGRESNLPSLGYLVIDKAENVLKNTDLAYSLIRSLYRVANYFYNRKNINQSMKFISVGNYIFDNTFLKKVQVDAYNCFSNLCVNIKDMFKQTIDSSKRDFKNDINWLSNLSQIIERVAEKDYIDSIIKEKEIVNEDGSHVQQAFTINIISARYFERLANFVRAANSSKQIESELFDYGKIQQQILKKSVSDETGVFPGSIDNSDIITFEPTWECELQSEISPDGECSIISSLPMELVYLKNGVKENSDYLYINSTDYSQLKKTLGSDIDIKRAYLPNQNIFDINYRVMKLMFAGAELKSKKNFINIKKLQVSRFISLSEFFLKLKIIYMKLAGYNVSTIKVSKKCVIKLKIFDQSKVSTFELIAGVTTDQSSLSVDDFLEIDERLNDHSSKTVDDLQLSKDDIILVEINDFSCLSVRSKERLCSKCSNPPQIDQTIKCPNCSYVGLPNIYYYRTSTAQLSAKSQI